MPQTIDFNTLGQVQFLVGSSEIISKMSNTLALPPFDDAVLSFLNDLSKLLIGKRTYSDIVTLGFWIRKANLLKMQERFCCSEEVMHKLGRGLVFHIAPSNVPVNFAYSLVSALLMGNTNIVRVPSKDFPQVRIITDSINTVMNDYPAMKGRIVCVRYSSQGAEAKAINDLFSSICDCRVIWGGDRTIETLRQSPLPPRSTEITFADRYSIAVIDADKYLQIKDKERVAQDFYNDTFFSDQNACTSPKVVIWVGSHKAEAKSLFWMLEHKLVKERYNFQSIQGVNKLTQAYLIATKQENVKVEPHEDNIIIRITVPDITSDVMNYQDNSGYFYEYDCKSDLLEIKPLCNDKRCQTIAYIGNKEMFQLLIVSGIMGVDRIVPIGQTMNFDLIWDGYNLYSNLSRQIVFV